MTHKERLLAALSHEQPDMVPIDLGGTVNSSIVVEGYEKLRRLNSRRTVSATPRQLESVIRLSEALAKMRLAEYVTSEDVEEAFTLMTSALQQAATDPKTGE